MEECLKSKKEICKFITCGSVDDGKSTLIGRILFDSKSLYKDQIESLKKDSKRLGTRGDELDFALLVDGLSSEREQGITIDVAYRYFSLENRRYVIIDSPGHEQYTKNMATGASHADVAIILLDARKGVLKQSIRHSYIASLLGIKQFIVAINKMDLVGFREDVFIKISNDYSNMLQKLPNYQSINVNFIPICATMGDNVVFKSKNTPYYNGDSLLTLLESLPINNCKSKSEEFILSVQYVNRPNLDFRGFCGSAISGRISIGDDVAILPSKQTSRVKEILNANKNVQSAEYKNAITIRLEDEIDIQRGDVIASIHNDIEIHNEFCAMIVCFEDFDKSGNYLIKIAHSILSVRVDILHKKDITTMQESNATTLKTNDIARCKISLTSKIPLKLYEENKQLGSFIIIDKYTNCTLAAGMIDEIIKDSKTKRHYTQAEIELNAYIRKNYPEWECKRI